MLAPAVFLVVLAGASSPPPAEVTFDVSGSVSAAAEGGLDVRIDLTNRGRAAASSLVLRAELAGAFDEGRLDGETPPGATRSVALHYDVLPTEPGVHPLGMRLEFAAAARPAESLSQAAYLLVALGANPPPAVRLAVHALELSDRDPLRVEVESVDGAAHRVRVRALTPRGLNAEPPDVEAAVPAAGALVVELPLLRAGAPRPSRQGVVVVAETLEGVPRRTSVATGTVDVRPDPALLPRLRRKRLGQVFGVPIYLNWVVAAALALFALVVLAEWRAARNGAARRDAA